MKVKYNKIIKYNVEISLKAFDDITVFYSVQYNVLAQI
jgi:hypothetical protein